MLKRMVLFLLIVICVSASFAGVADNYVIAKGEYAYGVWLDNHDTLIVQGGGADIIEAWDYSTITIEYTSISTNPSNPVTNGRGIWDIFLDDYSKLLYLDGATDEITLSDDATATLKGGYINAITSFQSAHNTQHIDLYCQEGWSWIYKSGNIKGITGLWENGDLFSIKFIDDDTFGYDPVWENVNVIEVPEPATLTLLSLGCLLIHKKK